MDFKIKLKTVKKVLIVKLEGELDHHTSEIVRKEIDAELNKGIVNNLLFNLERVSFMDSSGLGMLLGRYKKIQLLDGDVAICCIVPTVSKIFELSGIFKILTIYNSEEEAVNALGGWNN
ncbi:MAG: anti-sigma F factor antagonist [Vulcanibacillus sp.]